MEPKGLDRSRLRYILYWQVLITLLIAPQLVLANHSKGLHLQLPNKTIDIKPSCIETAQICQTGPDSAVVMLKLTASFAEELAKITESAVDQTVLFVWNGRVVYAETLKSPLGADLTIPNLTVLEADYFKK